LEGVREIERAWREIGISLREEDDDPHRFDEKEGEEEEEGGREGEGEGVLPLSMKRIAERYVTSLRERERDTGREEPTEDEIASTIEAQYHYLLHPPPSGAHVTLAAPVAAAGGDREGTGNQGEKEKEKKKHPSPLEGANHRQSNYISHVNSNIKRKQAAALEKIQGFVQAHGLREKVLMDLDVENRPRVKRKELTGVSPCLFSLARGWGMLPIMYGGRYEEEEEGEGEETESEWEGEEEGGAEGGEEGTRGGDEEIKGVQRRMAALEKRRQCLVAEVMRRERGREGGKEGSFHVLVYEPYSCLCLLSASLPPFLAPQMPRQKCD